MLLGKYLYMSMATLMYLVDGHFKLAIFEIDQSVQG